MNTLSAPTAEQELHLQAWRATALEKMPYMAALLFSMRPVNDPTVDTFAVDKHFRLYINFKNAIPKGPQFCAEALMHEGMHLLADHSLLSESTGVMPEEQRMWNYAGDCAINDDLRDAGCSLLAAHGVFAKSIGMDDYLTPMEYMSKLRELRDKSEAKKKAQQGQAGQDSNDEDGKGSGNSQQDDGNDQQGQDGSGNDSGDAADGGQGGSGGQDGSDQPLFKGCGSGSGGEAAPGELGDDNLNGEAPAIDPIDREMVRISTVSAIQQHQARHGIGSIPGGIAGVVEQILTPTKTPWERLAAANIRRCVAYKAGQSEATYSRRNRRRMNETLRTETGRSRGRVIAPGSVTPLPKMRFYRDTSASMGADRLEIVSREVVTISQRLGISGEDLIISDVDTMVYDARKYTGAKMLNTISGHGGTDMGAAIMHACSQRIKPSVIVVATDGETGWPSEKPSVPVVVLLVNATQRYKNRVPSWAKTVEVEID